MSFKMNRDCLDFKLIVHGIVNHMHVQVLISFSLCYAGNWRLASLHV